MLWNSCKKVRSHANVQDFMMHICQDVDCPSILHELKLADSRLRGKDVRSRSIETWTLFCKDRDHLTQL